MNTYLIALEEYNSEDDNGQHKLVYAYFGLAVYNSQVLEETFSNMIKLHKICKRKFKTNKDVIDFIDIFDNNKRTMGKFINELKQVYKFTDELKNELEDILQQRNNLVHRYFKNEIQKFYSSKGRLEMLKFFCDFIDSSEEIDSKLLSYYEIYRLKLNITDEYISTMIEKITKEEHERDSVN